MSNKLKPVAQISVNRYTKHRSLLACRDVQDLNEGDKLYAIPEGYQLVKTELLAEISSMCIGQISRRIPICAEYVGRRIHEETGLTEPELWKAAREQGE